MEPVAVERADAEYILAFYDALAAANRHYKGCQHAAFRQFVMASAEAPRARDAFARLAECLEKGGEEA